MWCATRHAKVTRWPCRRPPPRANNRRSRRNQCEVFSHRGAPEMTTPPSPVARVSHRIGGIAESATLAVDAKAKALKAAGRPIVGFGAGEPDFPTRGPIVAPAATACSDPRWHRYTPAGGLPELREAIAAKTLRDSGSAVQAAQ